MTKRFLTTGLPNGRTCVGAVFVLVALAGCAAGDGVTRGAALVAAKDWEAAIAAYRQANRAEPLNPQHRADLIRVTEQAITALLAEAYSVRESQPNAARELYARVLALDPRSDRALAGLRSLDAAERQASLYLEAERAQLAGRDQEARGKLRQLLDTAPDHAHARQLLRRLDDKAASNPAVAPTLHASHRRNVTLEFRDAPLRTVFDVLSRSTGLNFIFDRDIRQDAKLSIFVRDVPLAQVLEQLMLANGLAQRVVNGSTLLIYPSQPQKVREYQDLIVRNYFLLSADAKQITNLFKTVLKTRDIFTDERRNLVVIRDTPEVIEMANKLVAAHDQPEPEVMLEVEILEVKHSVLNDLGIKFPDQLALGVASPITLDAARNINGGGINLSGLDKAIIINLKRQVGSTNLLANPRIRVRNREKAKVHIGDRVPVITSTISSVAALTTESVSYLDVGIKLEVEPSIQLDDVVIRASLEVSSIVNTLRTNSGTTVYQLGTRNAATTLTLRDGETQILAGLLQRSERGNSSRLPGLGDMPYLGRAFSSEALDGDKTEVLLSITPRIMRNIERPSDDLVEFNTGPEAGRQGGGGQVMPTPAQAPSAPPSSGSSLQPVPATGSSGGVGGVLRAPVQSPFGSTAPVPTTGTGAQPLPTVPGPAQGERQIPRFDPPPAPGSTN